MRFFMLSDFHLKENLDEEIVQRIQHLCAQIRSDIDVSEDILLILMGDLIDRGKKSGFALVDEMLQLIRRELSGYAVTFEAIPENHDLVDGSIDTFSAYVNRKGLSPISNTCTVYAKQYGEVNFIFADSTLTRDYKSSGRLDLGGIQQKIWCGHKNFLFCHHGFTQSHDDAHNIMENGPLDLSKLEEMGISFVFHAHTHRADAGTSCG